MHFSPTYLGKTIAQGIAAVWCGTSALSAFTVGAGVGGIGQSALASNTFVKADSVLGQGLSVLTWKSGALGIPLSGWSCKLKELPEPGDFLMGREHHQIFLLPSCIP